MGAPPPFCPFGQNHVIKKDPFESTGSANNVTVITQKKTAVKPKAFLPMDWFF